MDYSVFRDFCRRPTWHTTHPSDERAFSAALRLANRNYDFSSQEMGEYIRLNNSNVLWKKSSEDIEARIGQLVKKAEAATKRKQP